ncbi:hypothetical protein CLAIMM_01353 [Cladophialophora immunda]|nr:hypothetical protein CLAIMM_01353 [Cladophialophora immunda]
MFFAGVRDFPRPQEVYHNPVYIPPSFETRLGARANSNSLVGSSFSQPPFTSHPRGPGITEFWECLTALQDPVPIYQSPFGPVTPVHEFLPNMASYDARLIPVREDAVTDALTSFMQNPSTSINDCYRSAVRNFLRRSVETNILDLVRRIDIEVEFALQIIRATKRPEQFTLEQMDSLQALGKSFTEMGATYREVWLEEVTRLNIWPHHQANIVDADEYQRYIGRRDWDAEWVRGTLERSEAEVGAYNNPYHGGNIINGDNGQDEGRARDVDMMDIVTIEDDHSSATDEDEETIVVGKNAQGITTWSRFVEGELTPFAQYEHGRERPWACLLCEKCVVSEKGKLLRHLRQQHGLTGLKAMKADEKNYSNFQGHDGQDCFIWGEYVRGDPRPWKCLLCANHAGVKCGRSTFARHFQLTHGIRVVLPPVTSEEIRRHNQRRQRGQQANNASGA